jgi:hypothetical protein
MSVSRTNFCSCNFSARDVSGVSADCPVTEPICMRFFLSQQEGFCSSGEIGSTCLDQCKEPYECDSRTNTCKLPFGFYSSEKKIDDPRNIFRIPVPSAP